MTAPVNVQHYADLVLRLKRAAEAIQDYEGYALGDDPVTFDQWIMLEDAAKAVEQLSSAVIRVAAIEQADRVDHSAHFHDECSGATSWKSRIGRDLGGVLSDLS